jgi:hypothetical protein
LRWKAISPNILAGTCPEGVELLDTPEFKRRLLLRLDFLRDSQRFYWRGRCKRANGFFEFDQGMTPHLGERRICPTRLNAAVTQGDKRR